MNRFMGMMSSSCIEISKDFKDENGLKVHIDAGPEGWTIIYADHSSDYKDVNATSEDNFKEAFETASKNLKLTPIDTEPDEVVLGEC